VCMPLQQRRRRRRPATDLCGYADPIWRRGRSSPCRWGCKSGRRAKPGQVYWRQSCGRACWVAIGVPTIGRSRPSRQGRQAT
jgi:hypothetical protein